MQPKYSASERKKTVFNFIFTLNYFNLQLNKPAILTLHSHHAPVPPLGVFPT